MPTYEYLCQTCSHRFETWQKMTEEPLTTCPQCGEHIRRVLFPAGIVFKGTGFYKTDHNKNSALPAPNNATNGESKKSEEKSGEMSSAASTNTSSENGSSKTNTPAGDSKTTAATP